MHRPLLRATFSATNLTSALPSMTALPNSLNMHSAHKTTRPSIFSTSAAENDEEEVRMGLLGPSDGHAPSPDDLEEEDSEDDVLKEKLEAHSGLTPKDKRAMALLVVLCEYQAVAELMFRS